jgi:polyisoprenoid-binding protein YceI
MVIEVRKVPHTPFWLALLFIFLLTGAAVAQQRSFAFDPAQTKIDFSLGSVMHTVHGEFQLKRGAIQLDDNGRASGEIVVDATSGDSGNKSRDKKMHKEILESEKYPEIIFSPKRFTGPLSGQGKSHLVVEGEFSMHGQTHPMTLTIDTDVQNGNAAAVTSFSVSYMKWGLKNPSTFLLRVSDKVDLTIRAVAHLAATAASPVHK